MTRHSSAPFAVSPRGEPEVVCFGVAFTYPTLAAAQAAVEGLPVVREPRRER